LKYKVIDLFAGCGGMSLGFMNAGFKIVAAYDNWKPAVDTYKKNFNHPIYQRDLADLSIVPELKALNADIIISGPPCQDFSSAGHRNEQLGRANLTISFADIVAKLKPKYFVMENVPQIRNSRVFKKATKIFKDSGYGLTRKVLDASRCGVPQVRKRFFVIGKIKENDDFLERSLVDGMSDNQMTLFDYFANSLEFEHYFRVPRSYKRRGIFSIYEPSMTIRGVDRPLPKGYPGHPNDSIKLNSNIRSLTVKERSLIQTFPEEFLFEGSKTNMNQIIGNAVPVKLAEYVANNLMEHIKNGKR